jgi:type IV secretion system protein VirD4
MTETKSMSKEDQTVIAQIVITLAGAALLAWLAVAWPLLAWSTLKGDPKFMPLGDGVGGVVRWIQKGLHGDPVHVKDWHRFGELMPSKATWIAMEVVGLLLVAAAGYLIWKRVDRWREQRAPGIRKSSLRAKVEPRSWAKPRDFKRGRRGRKANPDANDSWPLGRIRGSRREASSAPELHLAVVAPTRAGKSSRIVIPAARRHEGPAVVLSNKTDVLQHTLEARSQLGEVHVFAPMTDPDSLPHEPVGWTPLQNCKDWESALRMGQWLFDADPRAAAKAEGSSGARFYNREALAGLLPALLHAAALDDLRMSDVLGWLKADVEGLDHPRHQLECYGAEEAARIVAGVQALDERPRSYLLASASQLIDGYRFPSVAKWDRHQFDPRSLLNGGTLYLLAPESDQEPLAPIFGGLLGSVLRVWEHESQKGNEPPLLKILADEAANLAPLAKLPTYLSVSAGWNVRWCVVYQSLAQLHHRYGDEAHSILGNTLVKLFMGPIQDEMTRRYLVDLLDEEKVTTTSRTGGRSWEPATKTEHERFVPKVSAQGLMQLAEGQAILIHERNLPAVTYLPAHWERRGRRS